MERNRDARRGTVTAVNGSGLSRRRQRKGSYRDSPEEDGGMEMAETGRLRERASKKDRDRDRSGRNKRRRGERNLHVSNREEGDDSSSESVDEDEEEDDDASVHVRLPLPPPPNPGAAPSMTHNHHRRSFPMTAKVARPPAVWKAADEMIGVPVPRRARSSSAKRPQDFSVSGGGGEPIHPQGSTSPARPSPSSTAPISPTSSGASVRKKMKPISGAKHRPPKISKSSSVSEDLEIEVAEVLFGLTRQFQSPSKQETNKLDSKDTNGSVNDVKLRVSSPVSISPQPVASQPSQLSALPPSSLSSNSAPMQASAPKRKRPRPVVKMEDESSTTPASVPALPGTSVSSASKMELEPPPKTEASSPPRSEKIEVSTAVGNGGVKSDVGVPQYASGDVHQDLAKPESNSIPDLKLSTRESVDQDRTEAKEEVSAPTKDNLRTDLDVNLDGTTETKAVPAAESSREVKYSIDLMAPPGKSSPERECLPEYVAEATDNAPVTDTDMLPKVGNLKEEEKVEKTAKQEAAEIAVETLKAENSMPEDLASKKQIVKERTLDLQLDFDKQDKDGKQHAQKQQPKSVKIEPKQEKSAQSVSLPLPMPVPGWPGGFPSFGYMGQVPSLQPVVPMDGISGSSKNIQPPTFLSPQPRPKRCATHGYVAHNIHYHQQLSRMNPFWPAATAAAPMYGGKQYNLNMVPSSESSILGNSLPGSVPARKWSSVQDKGGSSAAAYPGRSSKDKNSAGSTFMEPPQRKQLVLQQAPQPGTATNMLHAPAFIFPINQQQAAAAAVAVARSGASISTPGAGNAAASSSSASSAVAGSGTGGPAATMSFSYPGLSPNEAHQYMAILQNGTYQFPIPAHVGAPPPYRGGSPAQAVPFFNGSFYSSPMLHPQHIQQQQHQQPPHQQPSHSHAQQGHQNPSTSSGSSSSQKPPQQSQRAPGGGAAGTVGSSHSLAASKHQRPHLSSQSEAGGDDNPSTPDSRVSQAQKSIYANNLAMAIHPQNFALISSAAAAAAALGSGGGGHNEKQQPPPQHTSTKVDLTTSQAFAMPFASFGGAAATPLPSLDFSSMVQNHALFQGIPEATRLGYQFSAATAGATHATQHKKPPHQSLEDGKSAGDSMNTSMTGEEERKIMTTSKAPASISQHSLNFSRPDSDPPTATILGNNLVDASSRTMNLIQAPSNVGRVSSRPGNAGPTTSGSVTAAAAPNSQLLHHQQQQQQHQNLIQLQKQQQQLQLQQQLMNRTKSPAPATSATVYADRLPAGSTMAKFPQALAGFPQALIQSSGATQSPQWKASTRAATPSPAAATSTSTSKSQLPQQQGRSMHQPHLTPSHQTQISFGVNSSKAAAHTGQHHLAGGNSNPSLSSAASIVVGSPQSTVSKSAGGSPRSSSSTKAGPSQATVLPHQQQQPGKNSPTSSSLKSSPLSNSSAPSILGHPHMSPASNASAKQQHHSQPQHHHHQQLHKQQPFPQAQFFFSNAYMTAQTSQSNGATAAAYYHQRRQSEQPPQQQGQQNSTPGSSGILSLCPSAMTLSGAPTTSDPAKAAAAAASANMKGIAAHGLLQHPAQFATVSQSASGAPHPLMSAAAAAAAFPYMHTMPSVSVKPAEQKPAAGNDNLHACWQPEKR